MSGSNFSDLKKECEIQASNKKCSIPQIYNKLEKSLAQRLTTMTHIKAMMKDNSSYKNLIQALIRFSFFVEPINDKITSTKFDVRWSSRVENGSKRLGSKAFYYAYSTFENCLDIFKELLETCQADLKDPNKIALLRFLKDNNVVAYEIPVDYKEKRDSMHSIDNIFWFWNKTKYLKAFNLRKYLYSQDNFIKKVVDDKIKVTTYLTDRAQTGDFKTNREKRWETNPKSPQFSFRRICLEIESEMLKQVVSFEGYPNPAVVQHLINQGHLEKDYEAYRCPITKDKILYSDFKRTIEQPKWGKSKYQMGHIKPLKATSTGFNIHSPKNICWISSDGNRIQGSLSVDETRALLKRIYLNYKEANDPSLDD